MKYLEKLPYKFQLVLAIVYAVLALFTGYISLCHAEGNFAVNLSSALGDKSFGVIGDYEKGIFEIEGNLQSGDAYSGNIDATEISTAR